MTVGDIQAFLVVVLSVLAFGMEVFALVDALRTRADAFERAGKLTKQRWVLILAVATALGFVVLPAPIGFGASTLSFLGLIAVVAAAVYLADVRPAVRPMQGGSGRQGPYGPW